MNPNDDMISFGNCFLRDNLNKFLALHDLKIFSCHRSHSLPPENIRKLEVF